MQGVTTKKGEDQRIAQASPRLGGGEKNLQGKSTSSSRKKEVGYYLRLATKNTKEPLRGASSKKGKQTRRGHGRTHTLTTTSPLTAPGDATPDTVVQPASVERGGQWTGGGRDLFS